MCRETLHHLLGEKEGFKVTFAEENEGRAAIILAAFPKAPIPTMLRFARGGRHWLIKSSFLAHFSPEICFLCIEHLLQLQIHAAKKEQPSSEAAYRNGVQSGLPHPERERDT